MRTGAVESGRRRRPAVEDGAGRKAEEKTEGGKQRQQVYKLQGAAEGRSTETDAACSGK